jgi:hypothetical protein
MRKHGDGSRVSLGLILLNLGTLASENGFLAGSWGKLEVTEKHNRIELKAELI